MSKLTDKLIDKAKSEWKTEFVKNEFSDDAVQMLIKLKNYD